MLPVVEIALPALLYGNYTDNYVSLRYEITLLGVARPFLVQHDRCWCMRVCAGAVKGDVQEMLDLIDLTKLPPVVDVPVAGGLLGGISRSKIDKLVREGHLRRVKIGRRSLVSTRSIAEYLDRLTGGLA